MNRPYHLDAEAIARRLNPSARRSPSGWWALPGICHDRRDRPHLGVRDNRGRDGSDVRLGQVLGWLRQGLGQAAIEGATGWRIWGQRRDDSPAPRTLAAPQNRETPRGPHRVRPPALGGVLPHRAGPGPPRATLGGAPGPVLAGSRSPSLLYSLAAGRSAQPAAPGRGRDRGRLRSARRVGRTLALPPQPDLHRARAPGR